MIEVFVDNEVISLSARFAAALENCRSHPLEGC